MENGKVNITINSQSAKKQSISSEARFMVPTNDYLSAGEIKEGLEQIIIDILAFRSANGEWPKLESFSANTDDGENSGGEE